MAVKKITHSTSSSGSPKNEKLIEKLMENSVMLQKKDAELMHSVKELITKIDKMLSVFEEASKHVMEVGEDRKVVELTDKLEELLEQNKTIAKGLLMLERYVRQKTPPM
jgi:DNA integrity scanning protein DisA with diadenylate cyclase activity